MLFAILLQISAAADQTFWERVADQAFSIMLLVAVATVLYNQHRKLETRLIKYMDDDRKQMLDVIDRNTRVMEKLEEHLERK